MDEFYDLLQVPRDASDAKIKKAYHRMSLKLHPDKGGDPKEFQKLKQAYEVLSDKQKRQQYDSVGLDIEENDGDDQMFASESKEILQIIGAFAIRTFIGLIFMFFIYYTIVVVLCTCGTLFLLYYSQTQANSKDPMMRLLFIKAATLTVLAWLSLWSDWFRWIMQAAVILELIGMMPNPPGIPDAPPSPFSKNITLGAAAASALLSWWFGKATSYFFYILILEGVLAFVTFLFFEFARVVVKTAMEAKLKKYGEKVREIMEPIKKENARLKKELERVKAQKKK